MIQLCSGMLQQSKARLKVTSQIILRSGKIDKPCRVCVVPLGQVKSPDSPRSKSKRRSP